MTVLRPRLAGHWEDIVLVNECRGGSEPKALMTDEGDGGNRGWLRSAFRTLDRCEGAGDGSGYYFNILKNKII